MKAQTDRINEAIKYLKNKNITETNNLIRAASVWVAERIALKKTEHRKKNESRWKGRIDRDKEAETRSQGRTGIEEKTQIE